MTFCVERAIYILRLKSYGGRISPYIPRQPIITLAKFLVKLLINGAKIISSLVHSRCTFFCFYTNKYQSYLKEHGLSGSNFLPYPLSSLLLVHYVFRLVPVLWFLT